MREFLVEISLHGLENMERGELDALRRAEAARAAELAADGTLVRLWRTHKPGWRNVGLWRASSEEQLRATISSLPLAPYMVVVCKPLLKHPNDPRPVSRTAP